MKKLLIGISLVGVFWTPSFAAGVKEWHRQDWRLIPTPSSMESQCVYVATRMAVRTTTNSVIVSSFPVFLHGIQVNALGGQGAKIDIWDCRESTINASGNHQIPMFSIDASSISHGNVNTAFQPLLYLWDVVFSSGLAVDNPGSGTPADFTVIYRVK